MGEADRPDPCLGGSGRLRIQPSCSSWRSAALTVDMSGNCERLRRSRASLALNEDGCCLRIQDKIARAGVVLAARGPVRPSAISACGIRYWAIATA